MCVRHHPIEWMEGPTACLHECSRVVIRLGRPGPVHSWQKLDAVFGHSVMHYSSSSLYQFLGTPCPRHAAPWQSAPAVRFAWTALCHVSTWGSPGGPWLHDQASLASTSADSQTVQCLDLSRSSIDSIHNSLLFYTTHPCLQTLPTEGIAWAELEFCMSSNSPKYKCHIILKF